MDGNLIEGQLPIKQKKLVEAWIAIHREELHLLWECVQNEGEYFKNVKTRGCTIEWANGEDVAPEHLYHDSIPINEFKKQ